MNPLTMTAQEYVDTLTGFDEIAIEKYMDFDFYEAAHAQRQVKVLRAIIFIQARRDGQTDPEAKATALGTSTGEMNDLIPDAVVEDANPEDPDSESGKDDSAPE